ncbi:Separin [Strongyloides ratti]|uniref:separase n=1 Tax=Strongyloides ratti TaxID=34506 RepID=A0A090L9P9_STRRB|nr:Separin [Strongyloides ratti]CEF66516.1 Separin [Strongyloides ratti]
MKNTTSSSSKIKTAHDKLSELVLYANKHMKDQWNAKTVVIKKILNITSHCPIYKDALFFIENDIDNEVWLDVVKRCLVELNKINIIQKLEGLYTTVKSEIFPLLLQNKDSIDKNIYGKSIALIRTLGAIYMLHGYYKEAIDLFKMVFDIFSRDFTTLTCILKICIITNDLCLLTKILNELNRTIQNYKLPTKNYLIIYKVYSIYVECHGISAKENCQKLLDSISKVEAEFNSKGPLSIMMYDIQVPLLLCKIYLKMLDNEDDGITDNYLKLRAKISDKLLPSILYYYYKNSATNNVPMDFDINGKNDNFVSAVAVTSFLFEESLLYSRMLQDSGRIKECNIKCLQLVTSALRVGCQYRFLSIMNTIGMSDFLVNNNPRIYDLIYLSSNTFDNQDTSQIENKPPSPNKNISEDSIYDSSYDYLSASDDSFEKFECGNLFNSTLNVKFHRNLCRCQRCKNFSSNKLMEQERLFSKWLLEQKKNNSSSIVESSVNYSESWCEMTNLYNKEWWKTVGHTSESTVYGIASKNSSYLFCGAIIKAITTSSGQFDSQIVKSLLKKVRLQISVFCSEFHNMKISCSLICKKYSLRSYMVIPNSCYASPLNIMNGIELVLDEIISAEVNSITKELSKNDAAIVKAFNKTVNINKQAVIDYIIAFNNLRLSPTGDLNYLNLRKYCNGKLLVMLKEKVKEIFDIFTSNLRFMDVTNKKLILSSLLRIYDIAEMDEWDIAWIVTECTGIATRSLISSTGSFNYYFSSRKEFKSHVTNYFPTNSTVVQLFMDDDNVLWLMKLHRNIKPLVIPLKKLHANYFNTIHQKFLDVHDKLTKESGQVSGRVFWSVRYSLEDSYKYICKKIQSEVLGSMAFLLLPYTELPFSSCFMSFVGALEKANYPTSVAISIASAIPFLTLSDFQNILKDITTIYPMNSQIIQSLSSLFKSLSSKITRDLKNAGYLPSKFLRNLASSQMIECPKEIFTTLILDNELSLYPWEMVSFFNYRPMIARMPSIMNYALLLKNNVINKLNTDNSYYIINPKGDLKDTEDWMLNLLKNMKWEGIKGQWPQPEIVKEFTSKKDLLVYIGHGNGKQVFRIALKEQKFRSAAILMGCSSVKLGPSSNGYSHLDMVENYFISSGPGILGCTMLVTDGEINKFFECIFKAFKNNNKDGNDKNKKTITYYMVQARESVRLRYLTAGTVVFYGIPTLLL